MSQLPASECTGRLFQPLRGAKSFMEQRARMTGDLLPRTHFRDCGNQFFKETPSAGRWPQAED